MVLAVLPVCLPGLWAVLSPLPSKHDDNATPLRPLDFSHSSSLVSPPSTRRLPTPLSAP